MRNRPICTKYATQAAALNSQPSKSLPTRAQAVASLLQRQATAATEVLV